MRPSLKVLVAVAGAALVDAGGAGHLYGEDPTPIKPPWQRLLQGADAKKAAELEARLGQLREAGKFEEAVQVAAELVALREKGQGKDHWLAASARWEEAGLRRVLRSDKAVQQEYTGVFALDRTVAELRSAGRAREAQKAVEKALAIRRKVLGEEHPDTAVSYASMSLNLEAQDKYAEAAEGLRKALAICRTVFGEDHPDTATSYYFVASNLLAQGKYKEAEEGFRKALAIRRTVFGEDHPVTAESYNSVAFNLQSQGRYKEAEDGCRKALAIRRKMLGEEHPDTATSYHNLATNLDFQGKYREAAGSHCKALAICRRVCGEEHPDTADSYNALAVNLNHQGEYTSAAEFYRKALAIRRKVLGEEHPDTAGSYDSVAQNLNAQGRYREAEEGFQKGLEIRRKVLGENHLDTARSYNNVAFNLQSQGRYKEAEEGYQKALDLRRKLLGEEHPDTALSYNNLAGNLKDQGRYTEAVAALEKALDINRKVLGEDHPDTAQSYNNLASTLGSQGKYREADEGLQKALAICRKVLGEEHPNTANSYNNVAFNLNDQGRYKEAEEGFRKALEIQRKVLGEDHPATAHGYNNVAYNLNAQGRYKEAEEGYRKALAICRKVLGETHPDTALCFTNLAGNLNAQGRYREAEGHYDRAADAFLASRLHIAASGLGRAAKSSERSPLLPLAALLARNGKPAAAWQRLEQGLGRGVGDDLAARQRRPARELARQTELVTELERLDRLLAANLALRDPTSAQREEREGLLGRRLKLQEELARFGRRLEETYGPAEGKVFDRTTIQAALRDDTALVGWIDLPAGPRAADLNGEHWAVLLRYEGEPIFERLQGSGPGGAWTEEDSNLPGRLHSALVEHRRDWQPLARQLSDQRMGPLRRHLAAARKPPVVHQLVVLPSTALAGVPPELLAEDCTVSHALSGTLYAHLRKLPAVGSSGLLAVADPVFDAAPVKPRPLPPGGVLLTLVPPGSSAAEARLRADDVLLMYAGVELKTPEDLKTAVAAGATADITVQVWREGKTLERRVRPGPLGVVLAREPAPRALAERYRLDRVLRGRRGDDGWSELPGTRVEVEALRLLFGDKEPRLLYDSEASEQKLDALAASGELGKYRYIHLATHGEVDGTVALRSAVILSRDTLPDPEKQLLAGKSAYDGRLTAEEMLRTWNLNSELVTLSACQTALGKYERGEGFVGFAQALLLCGSRSVCLSLWKVDDAATALLMQRFYANLLGKRDGLKAPMAKAEALREAKEWLRNLSREEALRVAAEVSNAVERGKGRPKGKLLPPLPEPAPAAKDDKPYSHPYYWAAFVLIGDPD
jgi:tetratricopeptide (TPR) repeat protein